MSIRQLQPCTTALEGVALLLLVQLQFIVREWVSSVLHFSMPYFKSPGAIRRRWDFCFSALGHITKALFLGENRPLQVCRITGKSIPWSKSCTQLQWGDTGMWLCGSCVHAAQLVSHSYCIKAQARMRHQSRKESAWTNVKLRRSQRFWFRSNWKQVVLILNNPNILFLELSDLDMSETTFSGLCSSLRFSAIWLSDLIVYKDKGMILRSFY